jgi:hypothetical protein
MVWYELLPWPVFQRTGLVSDINVPVRLQHDPFDVFSCRICMNEDGTKALEESLEEFINGFNPVP